MSWRVIAYVFFVFFVCICVCKRSGSDRVCWLLPFYFSFTSPFIVNCTHAVVVSASCYFASLVVFFFRLIFIFFFSLLLDTCFFFKYDFLLLVLGCWWVLSFLFSFFFELYFIYKASRKLMLFFSTDTFFIFIVYHYVWSSRSCYEFKDITNWLCFFLLSLEFFNKTKQNKTKYNRQYDGQANAYRIRFHFLQRIVEWRVYKIKKKRRRWTLKRGARVQNIISTILTT